MYDYSARYMEPAIGRFTSVDPLAEKYYSWSPYIYTFNNPIRFVDVEGLYPRSVLIKHNGVFRDHYTFTAPAARLLSLVSNVSENAIRSVRIVERRRGEISPAYDADTGGGAITLGFGLYNASIIYTQNFFEDDPKAYSGHGYGQSTYSWLSLSSHEVGHLNHIEEAGGLISYLVRFRIEYLERGYDNAPREIEADKGYNEFLGFNSYVSRIAGGNALINLIDSKKKDNEKINQINKWFDEYQFNKENKTKSFLDVMKNNYESLQEGTYRWNGNDWVRQ